MKVHGAQQEEIEQLIASWLAKFSNSTIRSYRADIGAFASWLDPTGSPATAIARLLQQDHASANATLLAYLDAMRRRAVPLSPMTLSRRVSALRSLADYAKRIGATTIELELTTTFARSRADLKLAPHLGSDVADKVIAHLEALAQHEDLGLRRHARRDLVIARLLWDARLRRHELVRITMPDDVDVDAKTIRIAVAGDVVTLSAEGWHALERWLELRGEHRGPLVGPLDRRAGSRELARLNVRSLNKILQRLAHAAGVGLVRPIDLHRGTRRRAMPMQYPSPAEQATITQDEGRDHP